MGGAVSKIFKKPEVARQIQEVSQPKPAEQKSMAQADAEDRSARRRARRGGRALLSEQRLNAEQGVQTLGQADM